MRRLRRVGKVATAIAASFALFAVSFTVTQACVGKGTPPFGLTAGKGFTITSTISSSSSTQTAALFYPGVERYLWLTVTNPLTVPITVNSLSITGVTSPRGCPASSNLSFNSSIFSGSLPVGANGGTNTVEEPISLLDTSGNQDACESQSFVFTYAGTARYTDATSTVLASLLNPSKQGQSVTFTATVTAANVASDPSLPSGSVNFYRCPTAACTVTSLLGTATLSAAGQATFATTNLPAGTDYVEAVYSASSTNFLGSTSNVVTQVVKPVIVATSTVLTSSPNPSVYGQSVTLAATVSASSGATPTGSVSFYLGTPAGPNTLLGTATLSSGKASLSTTTLPVGSGSLYAVYAGTMTDAGSTSATITQTVDKATTKTALSSSVNPSVSGKSVTFTATVTVQSPGAGTPTGTVTFTVTPKGGGSVSCQLGNTVSLVNGVATCTVPTALVASGSPYTVNAVYSGDGNFATSAGSLCGKQTVKTAVTP